METTGHRGLDDLRLNCTQLAIDDYKNYIKNWNRLNDLVTVQLYEGQKKLKRKIEKIEDYLNDGLFCSFADGVGKKVSDTIKEKMRFSWQSAVSDEEYNTAVKNLQAVEEVRPIFLTISEVNKQANATRKTVRANTSQKMIEELKKMLKKGYSLKKAIERLEKEG